MKYEIKSYHADLVIVGAGVPGICAAVQAAREGLKVALINDRGVLGGNGSCEINVNINGASDGAPLNINSREGGIVNEIITEWKYRSPVSRGRYILDGVFLDIVGREPNIKLFLNTCIDEAETSKEGTIVSVEGTQNSSETRWHFTGSWFVDNTGDGTLGFLAGAEYMLGREAKETFNEKIAPDKADKYVLPSTLMFHAHDMGYKVIYRAPDFAFDIPASGALERRVISQETFHSANWYYEIGGDYDHVKDREEIIKDHKSLVYGIWDYIKNSGKFPQADNYDFDYISTVPGTREYRRLVGDYILTEKDIVEQTDHEDTVGHGGWNIDLHAIKGFFDEDIINRHIHFRGIYKIPYRTAYSKNVSNMFMCGRCMSTSHVASGSTRVISTLATLGQAVGMAAALCKKYNTTPRGIYESHIKELQQRLLNEDQYIVGFRNEDEKDLSLKARVSVSSELEFSLEEQKNVNGTGHIESLVPEYRSRMRAIYEIFTDHVNMEQALCLSIPVKERLDFINIKVRVNKSVSLDYNIYLPDKPENYGPDTLVKSGRMELSESKEFIWVKIPVNLTCNPGYVLIELLENDHIDVAVGGEPLPTTVMFRSRINTSPTVWDVKTMGMSKRVLQRTPYYACFKTEPTQAVFGAENINDGYNRAYGIPHMWVSASEDTTPTVRLKWNTARDIKEIYLNFGTETYKQRFWEVFYDVDPFISRDYRVYASIKGEKVLLKEIKDNFSKLNQLTFDSIRTDELILELTPGSSGQVALYEVRVY
jgi:hypothetical protein